MPWQEAASSAGRDGTVAGEMPAARGCWIKIKERRGWKGPGSSQHKHKPHCGLVSHPRDRGDSRRRSRRPGNRDGISLGGTSSVQAWGSPLAPDGRGKLRHGAGGGKGLPQSAGVWLQVGMLRCEGIKPRVGAGRKHRQSHVPPSCLVRCPDWIGIQHLPKGPGVFPASWQRPLTPTSTLRQASAASASVQSVHGRGAVTHPQSCGEAEPSLPANPGPPSCLARGEKPSG